VARLQPADQEGAVICFPPVSEPLTDHVVLRAQLETVTTANQDPLLGYVPIVGVDM
jgi:hypothetical protein